MATAPKTTVPPRRWRLQFSLRLFFLAVLAFAVGFPIWYRWPYREVEVQGTPPKTVTQTTTWQRQWGGGRLKHGPETRVFSSYRCTTNYKQGVEDGPYRQLFKGKLVVSGQHRNGKRDSEWNHSSPGSVRRTVHWQDGKLDGTYEYLYEMGFDYRPKCQLRFTAGKLTHCDGQSLENRLYNLLQAGVIADQRLAEELTRTCDFEFFDTPLKDALAMLSKRHQVAIEIDATKVMDSTRPLRECFQEIDLCSTLTLLTERHGLVCDYRYGCLWITTVDDVLDWTDPTGVAKLNPHIGTPLELAWSEPVSLKVTGQPLRQVLTQLAQPFDLSMDFSQLSEADVPVDPPITCTFQEHPFRHVLGALLYQGRCRCEKQGDTLAILPQRP